MTVTERGPVDVINVYNPKPAGPRSQTPSRLAEIRQATQESTLAGREIILLGDFNLHHPHWGGIHCALDDLGDNLLSLTSEAGLDLVLPQGSVTWQRGGRASTIDLTFASEALVQRVVRCSPRADWAQMPDH